MLRSLTEFFSGRMRRARSCVGVALGRRHLWAVQMTENGDTRQLDWITKQPLNVPLFQGTPGEESTSALAAALEPIREATRKSFVQIQVALPDPAIDLKVFALEVLPGTRKERDSLVRFRVQKEGHNAGSDIACVSQPLGEAGGKQLLFGLAVDAAWLECVQRAFKDAELALTVTDMGFCYQFNRFHDLLPLTDTGGALVTLEPESWTLGFWDRNARLRFARSRWRQRASNDELAVIAADLERTIRAYVHSDEGHEIGCIYVSALDSEAEQMTSLINKRMNGECNRLPIAHGLSQRDTELPEEFSAPALAAASCR